MDENYLDSLLNEITLDEEIDNKIEEELDDELVKSEIAEKESMETVDSHVENDSKKEVEALDSHISLEQLDELDELDSLADLDMDGLDFDDIDFDDIDVTNIKLDSKQNSGLDLDDLDDLDIDDFFKEEILDDDFFEDNDETEPSTEELGGEELFNDYSEDNSIDSSFESNSIDNNDLYNLGLDENNIEDNNVYSDNIDNNDIDTESYNFDNVEYSDSQNDDNDNQEYGESQYAEEVNVDAFGDGFFDSNGDIENTNKELDDLFAMLGIEDEEEQEVTDTKMDVSKSDSSSIELADIPDEVVEVKKKKTLSRIIFGDPDEDEEEGISLEELEAKKAAKLAKKEEKKAAKEIKNQKKNEDKIAKEAVKKKNDVTKREKQLAKKQQEEQEALEAVPEKKVSMVFVIIIAIVGIASVGSLFSGTKAFNYKLVIERAGEYFTREKYRLAYDEVYGVDVKEKDQELKDRIYTVMYVERLYESYNTNFYELKRYDKALDSLLRGLVKYDEHYEEAVELNIVNDIDKCKAKIVEALATSYGITLEEANSINEMNDYDYVSTIEKYSSNITPEDETQAEEE